MDTWRLIHHPNGDPYWNMAVDEELLRSVATGQSPPTVRFYGWNVPTISLGRYQDIEGSLDQEFCRSRGIPIVRRPTGGRAVFHDSEITFSIVRENSGGSVQDSYRQLSKAVIDALLELGVPAHPFGSSSDSARMSAVPDCFDLKASFEVAVDGAKVFGCAQYRSDAAILQQNSLRIKHPAADNLNAFVRVGSREHGHCITDFAEKDAIIASLSRSIERNFGKSLAAAPLSETEGLIATTLASHKYRTDLWNLNGATCR
jgi:lipoyl(octanoyl) transferase